VGKPEGRTQLRTPRCGWVDNIKIYIRKIGRCGMNWIDLAQNREQSRALANAVMNLRVPQNFQKFLNSCTISSFPKRAHLHEVSYYLYMSCKHFNITLCIYK
jgi:hypothetical protein